jgi:hypothetical protein
MATLTLVKSGTGFRTVVADSRQGEPRGQSTTVNFATESQTAKGPSCTQMGTSRKANFVTAGLTAKGPGQVALPATMLEMFLSEISEKVRKSEGEPTPGPTVTNSLVIIGREKNTAKDERRSPMVTVTSVNFGTIGGTATVSLSGGRAKNTSANFGVACPMAWELNTRKMARLPERDSGKTGSFLVPENLVNLDCILSGHRHSKFPGRKWVPRDHSFGSHATAQPRI